MSGPGQFNTDSGEPGFRETSSSRTEADVRRSDSGVVTPDGRMAEHPPKWRRDFPVDLPDDHYVARRDFTKFMVLTSFAFVVGQVWIGAKNLLRRTRRQPEIVKIADVDSLEVGAAVPFTYPEEHDHCLLIRTGPDSFLAYDQKCTHLSCAVQPDVRGGQLICPCHQGFFELASGRPTAGPPRRPLTRILLEIRSGSIYATGLEART